MKARSFPQLAALAVGLAAANLTQAGQTCEEKTLSADEARNAFSLAMEVRQALDESGAQVALLGRVGQDLSKYGLRYSHVGFVWRDHPEGRWLGVHLLNECGTADSTLYNQGLANFFADDIFTWEALILIPSPGVQARLATELKSDLSVTLHQSAYNMLAYPFSTRYQNSNQWVLEMLSVALAEAPLEDRQATQRWLAKNDYHATTLEIPALTRLGARMFKANVAFDDHPTERRMAGKIDTVTVDSVADFLAQRDAASSRRIVRLPIVRSSAP